MTTRPSVMVVVGVTAAVACVALCGTAEGRELWRSEDGEQTVSLTTALKASTLAPEASAAANLWRLRFGLDARLGPSVGLEAAYEQRMMSTPGGILGGLGVLPSAARAPYRISQLDEPIIEEGGAYSYRHELDRALLALHTERAEVTVGRQAVGWGRGVLFGTVDVFSPFSPLEVDREWRRGIDALRADVRLTSMYSLDVVAAFGEDREGSACLGRFRGRTESGVFDSELVFGKRAEDTMYAGTFSASVGEAAVHGEIALFDTPEKFYEGGLFSQDFYVAKAVLGASYTFDVGRGLTVWAEYHFNGFGSEDAEAAAARLTPGPDFDPDYLARYVRGDMQTIGRHAAAVQAAYELSDAWTFGLVWIASGTDGSGVAAPTFTWNFADNVTIILAGYAPYGAEPRADRTPRSEYGGAPFTAFLQIRIYD